MSELKEECYKCLHNQDCISCADYGSIYCMSHRKFKMPKNENSDIKGKIDIDKLEKENDRLLELCMFALLPKRIYNHELATKTKEAFKNIIKQNINEDTHTIRNEIVRYWDGK